MRTELFADAETVAQAAARFVAEEARRSVERHGRFVAALSGGSTPWKMLEALAAEDLPWNQTHLIQVDERVVPAGSPERNLTHIEQCLLEKTPISKDHIYAMRVDAEDLSDASERYVATLEALSGSPPVLDLVHLGLGPDGHTASLVPGDPILDVDESDVATTSEYQGRVRMTLTYPLINRARCVLWLVTGESKAPMLNRLRSADETIPAGRVKRERAVVFADYAAAGTGRVE